MNKTVLGVKIDDMTADEALKRVEAWLDTSRHPKLVFTPGPEFLVTAHHDNEFKKILNRADLNLPDGFGLQLLAGIKNQVPGVDFMLALCRVAADKGWTVGLFGGLEGVAKKTAEKLREKFPKIKVKFAVSEWEANEPVDILFVALGHPKQEKFLSVIATQSEAKGKQSSYGDGRLPRRYAPRNDTTVPFRLGMGVGGSFDFISGNVWEPPVWMSRIGLKWLGRLLSNPRHLPRVLRALVAFPLLLLFDRE